MATFPVEPYADATSEAHMGQGLMRSINLRDLWAPVYRSRYAVITIFVISIGLAILASLFIQPRYRAQATVEIKSEAQKVLGTEDQNANNPGGAGDTSLFLDTQLDIIKSRSTTIAVAQSLGLYNDHFLEQMGVKEKEGASGTVLNSQEAHRKLVNQTLQNNLKVSLSEETRIAKIEFSSPDPRLAAQVANSYADNYIKLNLSRRFDASSYSLDFLRQQIREAQARLSNSERAAIAYARQAKLIDASNAAGTTNSGPQSLTTASLVGLNVALSDATAKRILAQQRWDVTRSMPLLDIPEVISNGAIQALQQQKALLQAQYQQQLQTRTEEYPAVRQLAAQIRGLDKQIASIANDVKSTIRSEYETARSQEEGLQQNLNQLKNTTLNEQNRSVKLTILRRESDTNQQQLDALLKRYNELNAESGVQLNNLSVIDHAEVPGGAYWPSLPLNLALGLILGILGSTVYVLGRENLFELIRTPDDVTLRLRQPILGAMPVSDDVMGMLSDPKSSVSEALSTIRTNLSLSSSEGMPRTIMVTSTQEGEGKSTICYGLAQRIAKLGHSVVLIDADIRRPNVHRLFGVKNTAGISNILSGSMSIDDVLQREQMQNLDMIVAGPIPPDAAELLASNRLARLIEDLSARYDHVLIDSAPVLGLADAPLVAANVAGVVFVVEAARTSVRGVQNALDRLRQTGASILGVVLSRFDPGHSGYSYEYQYAYAYSYAEDRTR